MLPCICMEMCRCKAIGPWAVWFYLSYLHALNFMLYSTKVRWKEQGNMSFAMGAPEYFLVPLPWDTNGCIRLGNHNSARSFCNGWKEEQGAKPQSSWKLEASQGIRGGSRSCCQSELMWLQTSPSSYSHHITGCCLKGQGHICEGIACCRITSPWTEPHGGGCSLANSYWLFINSTEVPKAVNYFLPKPTTTFQTDSTKVEHIVKTKGQSVHANYAVSDSPLINTLLLTLKNVPLSELWFDINP